MAIGLPVVCTDWDGYRDIVEEGVTGYRIPTTWNVRPCPEDVLASLRDPYDHSVLYRLSQDVCIDMDLLLARTAELVNHESRRRLLGDNDRRKAEETYSIKTEIHRFQSLWHELGEMAQKDQTEYEDASCLLTFDYPRHFRGYPTSLALD